MLGFTSVSFQKETGEFMISTEAGGICLKELKQSFPIHVASSVFFSFRPQPLIKVLRKHLTSQSKSEELES